MKNNSFEKKLSGNSKEKVIFLRDRGSPWNAKTHDKEGESIRVYFNGIKQPNTLVEKDLRAILGRLGERAPPP